MKIDLTTNPTRKSPTFSDLKPGDVFSFNGGNAIYIRTVPIKTELGSPANAVAMSDGAAYIFRPDQDVFPRSNAVLVANGI